MGAAHAAAHTCLVLFVLRHGSPECQDADALAVPAVPLYDSDDETTDSAVISALASKWTKGWAVAQPARQQEATRHMVQPKFHVSRSPMHSASTSTLTGNHPLPDPSGCADAFCSCTSLHIPARSCMLLKSSCTFLQRSCCSDRPSRSQQAAASASGPRQGTLCRAASHPCTHPAIPDTAHHPIPPAIYRPHCRATQAAQSPTAASPAYPSWRSGGRSSSRCRKHTTCQQAYPQHQRQQPAPAAAV